MMQPNEDLLKLIDSFAGQKLLVIGEAMLDSYLQGATERLSREAPVPIVDVQRQIHVPGGAANTAVNLRSLGAQVTFLSVIGADPEGDQLTRALEEHQVPVAHLLRSGGRSTLSKQRVVANSQTVVRFDQGSTSPIEAELEAELCERLEEVFHESDGVVISDYNYGILTEGVRAALARLQKEDPHLIVVDARHPELYSGMNVTVVKPNYEEAVRLLGLQKREDQAGRLSQIEEAGRKVLELTQAQIAAITLDSSGALIFHRGEQTPYRTYATPRPSSRTSGAGDTFVSGLAVSLAAGADVERAAELASAAAAIAVSKDGTASCFAEELKGHFSMGEKFVSDVFQLVMQVSFYRQTGRRIVFTNGCFDILHRGHIAYLNRAKALGDILIVGLNSDDGVRRLKGPARPINPLEDRAQVLAALSSVDHIVSFDEDTPTGLIRVIRPDVFAKGGDYTRETLPEADLVEELGGRVEILPYLEDHSTTSVIEKIRSIVEAKSAQPRDELSQIGGAQSHDP
ncbi:MAG: D-glycero-beta-D-manno-heptose 1-phosphate adenylyltransferase [Bacteroidota bacterium]